MEELRFDAPPHHPQNESIASRPHGPTVILYNPIKGDLGAPSAKKEGYFRRDISLKCKKPAKKLKVIKEVNPLEAMGAILTFDVPFLRGEFEGGPLNFPPSG